MADNLYYWDEISLGTFRRKLLGEIISDFNFSLSIDGAKDSAKLNIVSYTKNQVKPYTIIEHEKTNTWWVVASDRIDRFQNDDGFYYYHELELVGAIELLNTCDLVDCGCLSDRYSINDIINKLIKLSPNTNHLPTFETNSPSLDLNQIVNYTKTFENYTLLSALREMFDGYNCAIKLEFEKATSSGITYLSKTKINVISKTGDGNVVQESVFNFVQEKTNINKNNYGTSVVSNVQNAISSKAKTYPAVGSVRLSGNEYTITPDSAVLKLPSPVYDINWLKMIVPVGVAFGSYNPATNTFYDYDDIKVSGMFQTNNDKQRIIDAINNSNISQTFKDAFLGGVDEIFEKLKRAGTIPFYSGSSFDPLNANLLPPKGKTNPYFAKAYNTGQVYALDFYGYVGIVYKQLYDNLNDTNKGICWERGSDEIKGFRFLGNVMASSTFRSSASYLYSYSQTDLLPDDYFMQGSNPCIFSDYITEAGVSMRVVLMMSDDLAAALGGDSVVYYPLQTNNVRFVVNYIPMSDMKIKYDNGGLSNISNLYNQTGKITDSVALSKLILSHSKEIESDKITKYASFYDFNSIPKVGNIVNINNEKYVIGSVSLDFEQNEYDKYYITGEFSLSKAISTKSLLTNPDTNIRDYNIPQNLNVKRKQLYRDFYEITHTRENSATPIQNVANVINLSNTYVPYANHTAVIKLIYDGQVGGDSNGNGSSNTWYYQLDSFTYIMKKAIYEVVDFKDNNIIGYDAMNTNSGFKINEIFTHNTDYISTPISYVDDYGKVKDIKIAFCNENQLSNIYDGYDIYQQQTNPNYANVSGGLMNYSVFIASQIYEGISGSFDGAKDNCDYKIEEENYNKDAIEVPVFEYACQFDDSNDVIVGDNIFDGQEDDLCYFYSLYLVDKGTKDNNNYGTINISNIEYDDGLDLEMYYSSVSCKLEIGGASNSLRNIRISQYLYSNFLTSTNQMQYDTKQSLDYILEETNKDLVIIRHTVKKDYTVDENNVVSCTKDLMFVIKNLENANIDNGDIVLQLNCYNVN